MSVSLTNRRELVRRYVKGTVIDIGIKDGYVWDYLTPDNVVGVDLDPWRHANFIQADGRLLPIKDKCFDTAVITEVLEHLDWDDRIKLLDEAVRVTRKVIIISVPDPDPRNMKCTPDTEWRMSHPLYVKTLRRVSKPEDDIHRPELMFDVNAVVRLLIIMLLRYQPSDVRVHRIRGSAYTGYGIVMYV